MGSDGTCPGAQMAAAGSRCTWPHLGQSQQQPLLVGNILTGDIMLMP